LAGEEYVVVPVVLMVEGTFKGNNGDFKYTQNHLSKYPEGWNNKPVLLRHPTGTAGAGSASVLEKQGLGILLNSKFEDAKLKSEAWLKVSRLSLEPRLLTSIEAGTPVAVSTGLFHDFIITENSAEAREVCNIVPDHLAILFDEDPAVPIEAGAGLLMNAKGPTQNELVAGDTREQLYAALTKRFIGDTSLGRSSISIYVEDFYPASKIVIFEWNGTLYSLGYTAKGDVVSLAEGAPERVVRQRQYRVEAGAMVGTTNNSKESNMTKATLIAAILGVSGNRLTQEQLDGMDEAVLANLAPTAEAAPVTENAKPAAPAAPFDFNAWMNAAPENVRSFVNEGVQGLQVERTNLIAGLTTNGKFTEAELAPMGTGILRKMASTLKPAAPATAPGIDIPGMHFRFAGAGGVAPTTNAAGTEDSAPTPLLAPDYSAQG
jgi:hypothetical protein